MVDIPVPIPPLAGLPASAPAIVPRQNVTEQHPRLRAEAERFEAAFLAEMLRHSGLGRMPERFNGGAGEASFAGTLVQEYANRIAATGSLGIAEQIYRALIGRSRQ